MTRPSWADYFLGIAEAVGPAPTGRADCTRRRVGAVITLDNRIVSCGYNGAPSGEGSCLAGDCPRGRHYPRHDYFTVELCACGNYWPCPDAVDPGSSYDTGPGSCIAVHAEVNACLHPLPGAVVRGGSLWITARDGQGNVASGEPCAGCWRVIKAAGIASACWRREDGGKGTWSKSDAPG